MIVSAVTEIFVGMPMEFLIRLGNASWARVPSFDKKWRQTQVNAFQNSAGRKTRNVRPEEFARG